MYTTNIWSELLSRKSSNENSLWDQTCKNFACNISSIKGARCEKSLAYNTYKKKIVPYYYSLNKRKYTHKNNENPKCNAGKLIYQRSLCNANEKRLFCNFSGDHKNTPIICLAEKRQNGESTIRELTAPRNISSRNIPELCQQLRLGAHFRRVSKQR